LAGPLFVAKDPAIKRSVILTETIGRIAGRDYYRAFVRFDDQDSIIAVMDTDLHSHTNHIYDAMWHEHQVYCNEVKDVYCGDVREPCRWKFCNPSTVDP
jgi:hypothetical protein